MNLKFNKTAYVFLLAVLFSWNNYMIFADNFQKSVKVVMLSRLDFVPSLLDMVNLTLSQRLEASLSFTFFPMMQKTISEKFLNTDLLLVERGAPAEFLDGAFENTGLQLPLVWVLALRDKAIDYVRQSDENSLENLGKHLLSLREKDSIRYPWFEPLLSRNTFLNFHTVLGPSPKHPWPKLDDKRKESFWEKDGVVGILHRAIEQGALNPLSVEADETLAYKVFESGDSQMTTMWVPQDYLASSSLIISGMKDVVLIPFPGWRGRNVVPRIVFQLWKKNGLSVPIASESLVPPEPDTEITFSDRSYSGDLAWIKNQYIELYDRLIMGEF